MIRLNALFDRLHPRRPAEPVYTAAKGTAPGTVQKAEVNANGDLGAGFVSGGRSALHDAAKPAVHLPVEIIELIIWHLYDDAGTLPLRACSLVHQSWLRPARDYLFECVQFVKKDGHAPPYKQRRSIAPHMRQLRIVGSGLSSATPRLLYDQLVLLESLVTARFCRIFVEGIVVYRPKDIDELHSLINKHGAIHRVASQVTHLTINRCSVYHVSSYLGFLASFTNLKSLSSSENGLRYRPLSTSEILQLPVVDHPGQIVDISWSGEIDSYKDFFVLLSRTASVHTVRTIRGRWQSVSYFKCLGHLMKASTSLQSVTVDIRSTDNRTSDMRFSYPQDIRLFSASLVTFNLTINPRLAPAVVNIIHSLRAPCLQDLIFTIHIWKMPWIQSNKRNYFAELDLSSYPLLRTVIVDLIGQTHAVVQESKLSDHRIALVEGLSVLRGKYELRINMPHARFLPPDDQIIIQGI